MNECKPLGSGVRSKRWLDQIVDARIRDAEMNGPPGNMVGRCRLTL